MKVKNNKFTNIIRKKTLKIRLRNTEENGTPVVYKIKTLPSGL